MAFPSLIQFLPLAPHCTSAPFFSLIVNTSHVLHAELQAPRKTNWTLSDPGPNFQQDSLVVPPQVGCPLWTIMSDQGSRVWGPDGLDFRVWCLVQHFAARIASACLPLIPGVGIEGVWLMGLFLDCNADPIENCLFALYGVDHKMEFPKTKFYWFHRLMWATSRP